MSRKKRQIPTFIFMDAQKLKKIRKLSKVSQKDFGRQIYASREQIRDWEQGLYKIPRWAEENIKKEFGATEKAKPIDGGHLEDYGPKSRRGRKLLKKIEDLLATGGKQAEDEIRKHVEMLEAWIKSKVKKK